MATIRHQDLVEGVRARSELNDPDEVRAVTSHVIEALARCLDGFDREQLAAALPAQERGSVHWDVADADRCDPAKLADEVARRTGHPAERARYLAQAVLSELADADPALGRSLKHRLPDELTSMFGSPVQEAQRQRAAVVPEQPRPLDAGELSRVLEDMPAWSGDTHALTRTVSVPPERARVLFDAVERAQLELGHRAEVEQLPDGVRFTLRTRSIDAVTELDLQLARSINDSITRVAPTTS